MGIKDSIKSLFSLKNAIYLGLIIGALLIAYIAPTFGIVYVVAYSLIPLALLIVLFSFKNPYITFLSAFILNYFLMGIVRYVPSFPGGVALDALLLLSLATIVIKSCFAKIEWKDSFNGLTIVALIWFIYCGFEFFNPMAFKIAWLKSIRAMAAYFLLISFIAPLVFRKFHYVKHIVIILSVLTLLSVAKVLIQKFIGFDRWENVWLYVHGGASTHIIHSGIRYFSFFTDAGNYGAAMGFAMVLFSIIGIYEKKKIRYYLFFVAFAAMIGLFLSGTRGALAVPFVGYLIFILLLKNIKMMIISTILFLSVFALLKYTNVGNGNQYIRRARSAFNENDPSLQVRLNNQKKLAVYLKDLPFGTGIGLGGGKAKEYAPGRYLSQIPTDSQFVLIWVETGVVGLILFLSIQLYILIYGCYLVLFKLKKPLLKGVITAMICGVGGMLVASYGNEVWTQLPNIFILTLCQVFIFLSPKFDKELEENEGARH